MRIFNFKITWNNYYKNEFHNLKSRVNFLEKKSDKFEYETSGFRKEIDRLNYKIESIEKLLNQIQIDLKILINDNNQIKKIIAS
ncbi:MAG: hypothetical protein HPAVJP_2280 [Candidatus Hepatoplasma vulgare]|nr:MAG: hypothetical protein HPAVJP_2280 [Candidatus Hepatoplasma sp.]